MDAPIVKVIMQRYGMDCSVACLAMICGVSYENALVAIAQAHPDVCVTGVWTKGLQAAARRLGFSLRTQRKADLDTDTGVLNVSSKKWKHDHLVVLREGLVIETDGTLWEQQTYFAANKAKPGTLFVAERIGP